MLGVLVQMDHSTLELPVKMRILINAKLLQMQYGVRINVAADQALLRWDSSAYVMVLKLEISVINVRISQTPNLTNVLTLANVVKDLLK